MTNNCLPLIIMNHDYHVTN